MNFTIDRATLTLYLTGRIDSANANDIEAEMLALCSQHPADQLVLDLEALKYISSAGLRVVLRLRKAHPEIRLINAGSEVYDILDMTGFTEMMTVEKAYRRLSVDGCELIGQGANGKVYRINDDTIIKVYRSPDALPDIQRERELARKAFIMGIPTAIPYDVVKVGEGYGSVFELLNAQSFIQLIQQDPARLDECVHHSVELLKKIHATTPRPGDMPDANDQVMSWAAFVKDHIPAASHDKLTALLAALPRRQTMMHGDFHMKNIMLQNGEVLLIDMDTLCVGHPIFEFAQIYAAYVVFGEPDPRHLFDFFGIAPELCGQIWEKTLALYFSATPELIPDIKRKASLVAHLRIYRRAIRRHEDQTRIDHARTVLLGLIDEVDTLDF